MIWTIVAAYLVGCTRANEIEANAGATDAATEVPDADTVRTPIVDLTGDDALDTSDLVPVAEMLRGADVIGIGEAIHTSAGFLHMRNRLLRHMIEHDNLRVVAFEESVSNIATVVAPYTDRCEGTTEDAALGINRIWWDESTPAFLEWLCGWNRTHPLDPVRVVGIDIRQPWIDVPALRTYVEALSPGDVALVDALDACIGATHEDELSFFGDEAVQSYYAATAPSPEGAHEDCAKATRGVMALLEAKTPSDPRAHKLATLALHRVSAFDETVYHLSRLPGAWSKVNVARDRAMSLNLLGLRELDFPSARVAIWAHNGHVFDTSHTTTGVEQWAGVKNLGTLVSEAMPGRYAAVGQYAFVTNFKWFERETRLPRPKSGSLEATLETLGRPFIGVDVRAAVDLLVPGERYSANFEGRLIPADAYRVILFQRESRAPVYFRPPI